MIIFLYGPDSYRSRQKLNEVISHYKEVRKSSLNLISLDADETTFADFYNNFKIYSMFPEKKLIILKNVFLNKNFQESLLEELNYLESLKDVIVIYENIAVDHRIKIFKDLKKNCKSQDFSLLDSKNIKTWAQKEFARVKQKINNDALDLLLSYVGNDLWRFSEEIKKLSSFRQNAIITRDDVGQLVRQRLEVDIFKTIDALASKDKKQALELLKEHMENGDSPLYLLSMITYQFRNLLLVKELASKGLMYSSIVKKSGLHPFVVKKNYFACSQFSFEELQHIYKKIFQIDLDIKTGKIEPETALDLLVSQIS